MEFYHLPLEKKLEYGKKEYKRQRGYIPFGLEQAVGETVPDLKEFYHIGRPIDDGHKFKEFYPKNVWPKEIQNFRKCIKS